VAATFGIGPDDHLVAIERLRSADGEPLVLMRNWLPLTYAFLLNADLSSTGLYQLMRERGDVPSSARRSISASAASQRAAELLGVRRGSPLLRVRHVGYDAAGRVLEVGDHLYRGDDHTVEVVVG
jgi:DNA-binding GntR family transcriptional regulator